MVRCGLPWMEIQSLIDHCVTGATLQQPKAYLPTMPPRWANARGGCAFLPQVGSASHLTSPFGQHPYPSSSNILSLYKGWSQVDTFFSHWRCSPPTSLDLHNFFVRSMNPKNDHFINIYSLCKYRWTPHLPHYCSNLGSCGCSSLCSPWCHSQVVVVPRQYPTQIAISPSSHLRLRCT